MNHTLSKFTLLPTLIKTGIPSYKKTKAIKVVFMTENVM